jgi:hypothetical protein
MTHRGVAMTAPEVTPAFRRAAQALHTAWTGLPREVYGQAASGALTAAALAAGLDVEEMARELGKHNPVTSVHGTYTVIVGCSCMDRIFVRGQETWDGHLAVALRAWILGEAP